MRITIEDLEALKELNDELEENHVETEKAALGHVRARLTTLGPAATLARGYAVVQRVAGPGNEHVVSSIADAPPGSQLRIRVSDGAISAAVLGTTPAPGRTDTPTDTGDTP